MTPLFFNTHHAPAGAFASFTLGQRGASGGLDLERGCPAGESIYIGCESGRTGVFEALPFFDAPVSPLDQFGLTDTSVSSAKKLRVDPFPDAAIQRSVTACTDTWT
ncbi:MAG: hypothetical protein JW863_13805, partial [Chitinispirillaceae bacterium]|nr:hypothetical protein [Chitinispirillaceae bacterium]